MGLGRAALLCIAGLALGGFGDRAEATVVATQFQHSCAITSTGRVWCWGDNTSGQLGDGIKGGFRSEPRPVVGLDEAVKEIAVGAYNTCALTVSGTVKCWGNNVSGSLGDGTRADSPVPVDVIGLTGITTISGGGAHYCAIGAGGAMQCWGRNEFGQLGNDTTTDGLFPDLVGGLASGVTSIATGADHSCALIAGGFARCWGRNRDWQLGTGISTLPSYLPAAVAEISGASAIFAGYAHTCVVMSGGNVKCWGLGTSGQLGVGTTNSQPTQVDIASLGNDVLTLALGVRHSCAITSGGRMRCWGGNESGQLGDASRIMRLFPVDVVGLSEGVQAIGTGDFHSCALTSGGALKCWGSNGFGQLGDTAVTVRRVPVTVPALGAGVKALAAGLSHSCAITAADGVRCWGNNSAGQVGDTTFLPRPVAVDVIGLTSPVQAIAAGAYHTFALLDTSALMAWGLASSGQVGVGFMTDYITPATSIGDLPSGVLAVAGGGTHGCALVTGGGVKCWGQNTAGEVGDGSTTMRIAPANVSGLGSSIQAVATGFSHTCALTGTDGVKCWGRNSSGQVGVAGPADRPLPVDVTGLGSGVQAVAAGGDHSCAILDDGSVVCWGANRFGELGDGTFTDRSSPAPVIGLGGAATALAVGFEHTCALLASGAIRCWGRNLEGQIGDGSTDVSRPLPVGVTGLDNGVQSIVAGTHHTCALRAGVARCWGTNGFGQLGIGPAVNVLTPIDVSLAALTAGIAVQPSVQPPPAAQSDDEAGSDVDMNDEFFVVGAPGKPTSGKPGTVYIYRRRPNTPLPGFVPNGIATPKQLSGGSDELLAELTVPAGAAGDDFGRSVAISRDGGTIVAGAPGAAAGVGRGYVYRKPPTGWANISPIQTIAPTSALGDVGGFGGSVAIDEGGGIAVGAPASDVAGAADAGLVQVYRDPGTGYGMVAEQAATNAQAGAGYGSSVGMSASLLAVGSPREDVGGEADAGAAYFYKFDLDVLFNAGRVTKPPIFGVGPNGNPTRFGGSVGVDGGVGVVGAPGADTSAGVDSGGAVVYGVTPGGTVEPTATLLPTPGGNQGAGRSLAVIDGVIALGSPFAAITGQPGQGRVYVYETRSRGWTGVLSAGVVLGSAGNRGGDNYGHAVALGGDGLLTGVPFADRSFSGTGEYTDHGRADAYTLDRILRGTFE